MQDQKKRIVVVGSINMDLVAYAQRIPREGETITGSDFQMHPGGKGANQAVATARLGWPVAMIGRVGDDAFGAQLKGHLKSEGVDVSGVAISECSSGVASIVVSQSGANCIVVSPGANARLMPSDLDANADLFRSAGMVLTQLEIPTETVEHLAMICEREGVPLMLDPAPARFLARGLLERVDWFTPNEIEADFFVQNAAQTTRDPAGVMLALRSQGIQGVVLKRGDRGVYVAPEGDAGNLLGSFSLEVRDTTAAGDCFNGAFAVGLMMGKTAAESAKFATAAASVSVTRAGAQTSMPTMIEVQEFLERA